MTSGPLQVLVVGFGARAEFSGEIVTELRRLSESGLVRLADLRFVTKDADGTVTSIETSELSDEAAAELGDLAGVLVGFGAGDEELQHIADTMPRDTSAAVVVLEHRWAIPLREAIERADGGVVADAWLRAF